jgi:uncharacterized membrane protein
MAPVHTPQRRTFARALLLLFAVIVLVGEILGLARPVLGLLPTAIQWLLGVLVSRTLLPERAPVARRIAEALHDDGSPLPPDIVAYTRGLTGLWAAVFFALGAINLAWYVAGFLGRGWVAGWIPLLLDTSVVGLLILGEFLYRRQRFAAYTIRSLPEFLRRLRHIDLRRIVAS